MGQIVKIMRVDEVEASIGKSIPPTLSVKAMGTVNTSGWKNGQLSPYVYIVPPADGIQDFDFLAEKPGGITNSVMQPITAGYDGPCDDWVKGVRVHSASNEIESLFE